MDTTALLDQYRSALVESGQHEALRILQNLEATSGSHKRKPQAYVACTLCRRCKAKCVRSNPLVAQCDRCRDVGCVCIVEGHKRGRKRVRGLDLPRAEAQAVTEQSQDEAAPSIGDLDHDDGPYQNSQTSPLTRLVVNLDPESEDESDITPVPALDQSHYAANALPFISGSNRPFSLRNLLNTTSANGGRAAVDKRVGIPKGAMGDLVSREVISIDMARQLFSLSEDSFIQSLNPIIMLFDPDLHTFGYIRAKSRFLFATILAAAAKFIAPSISGVLAQEIGECSIQAILGGRRSVETVQSWMMIYFWKAPRDNRAWTYVGLLCRLAVEIGLDRTPLEDNPGSTDEQQRERRNRIRTWMLAYMMDRALSSTTGRDWCLRGQDAIIQNPRQFSHHILRHHGDAVIAGFTELRRIASEAIDQLSPTSKADRPRQAVARLLHTIKYVMRPREDDLSYRSILTSSYDLDEWSTFWQNEMSRHGSPGRYWAYLRFFELHIRLTLNSFGVSTQQLLNPVANYGTASLTPSAEQKCYSIATENLMQLRLIRDLDVHILQHAQDSISIMVAYAACFLRALANSPNLFAEQRAQAIDLIDQTSKMFKIVGENRETTATLQADFLESLAAHHRSLGGSSIIDSAAQDLVFGYNSGPGSSKSVYGNTGSNGAAPPGTYANTNGNSFTPQQLQYNPPGGDVTEITDFDAWISAFAQDHTNSAGVDPVPEPVAQPGYMAPLPLLPPNLGGADLSDLSNTDWDSVFAAWLNPVGGLQGG